MSQIENTGFRYPKELVSEYGAKAGILMYVAKHLPGIPQMPMVVSEIGEPAKDFLARVDQAGISWPRIFRSSSIAELVGREGDFPTHILNTYKGEDKISRYFNLDGDYKLLKDEVEFNLRVEDLVREIAYSPRKMREEQLPSEINVIAAQFAPCKYRGSFIKHPNQENYYLTTLINEKDSNGKITLTYRPTVGFNKFGASTISWNNDLANELEKVIRWHDSIAKLPEMDSRWVYVIEYGLMPTTLFQVHYFKPMQKASFTFDVQRVGSRFPIVMGVTGRKGRDYEVAFNSTRSLVTNLPVLYFCNLHKYQERDIKRFKGQTGKEPQGYMFYDSGGILAHQDVKALRQSELALLYLGNPPDGLRSGMVVNIASDGRSTKIIDKLTGEEVY